MNTRLSIKIEESHSASSTTKTASSRSTSTVVDSDDQGRIEGHATGDATSRTKAEAATSRTENATTANENLDSVGQSSKTDIEANDVKFNMKPEKKYKCLFYKIYDGHKKKQKQKIKKKSHKNRSNDEKPEFFPDTSEDAFLREKKQQSHIDFEDDSLVRDKLYNDEVMLMEAGAEDLRKGADKVVSTFFFQPIVSIEETDKRNEIDLMRLEMMLSSLETPTTEVKNTEV